MSCFRNELDRFLVKKKVIIKDRVTTTERINEFIKRGQRVLQIVTDFDSTLTKQHVNGELLKTTYGAFNKCNGLPPRYVKEFQSLYERYHAIEGDLSLEEEERNGYMMEWYERSEELLNGFPFDLKAIDYVMPFSGMALRDGVKEMMRVTDSYKIPVVILSEGLGDVISSFLKENDSLKPNVHVVSNFLNITPNGTVSGYRGPYIHPFNKAQHAAQCLMHYEELDSHQNVIIMGDKIADAEVEKAFSDFRDVLTVGFYNGNSQDTQQLEQFCKHFDVVLVNDQTMTFVNLIIKAMIRHQLTLP